MTYGCRSSHDGTRIRQLPSHYVESDTVRRLSMATSTLAPQRSGTHAPAHRGAPPRTYRRCPWSNQGARQ
jgi:hypothetical protein